MTEMNKPAEDGVKTTRPTKATSPAKADSKSNSAEGMPPEALANEANPKGRDDVSTGPVGDPQVIDAQEHVLGDDPRRVAHASGYHDSLTGRPVTENGDFTEESMKGQGPIPKHRIVADQWPTERDRIDSPASRIGNDAD